MKRRVKLGAGVLLCAAMLGGCAETRESISAGVVRTVTGTALGPKPTQTADFVTRARAASSDYMPVGVTPPARSLPPKSKAEVASTEAAAAAEAARVAAEAAASSAEGKRVTSSSPKPPKID
ncbi:MAG: hypothetical protein ABWZ80_03330 [Beijerinckiaceae bacterium]